MDPSYKSQPCHDEMGVTFIREYRDFKSVANMFKHLDDEVCSKPVNERNNLVCSIKIRELPIVTLYSLLLQFRQTNRMYTEFEMYQFI